MPRGMGRPMAALVLSDGERTFLEAQVRRHRVARSMSDRCRMILRCAEGLSNKAVAAEVGVSAHTVGKWRRRFLENRIDGLLDEPLLGEAFPGGIFPAAPALHAECRAGLVLRKCAEAAIKPDADFGDEPSRVLDGWCSCSRGLCRLLACRGRRPTLEPLVDMVGAPPDSPFAQLNRCRKFATLDQIVQFGFSQTHPGANGGKAQNNCLGHGFLHKFVIVHKNLQNLTAFDRDTDFI